MPSLSRFDPLVMAAATRYGLPAALIKAIIRAESNGDPLAFNPEGDGSNPSRGLMQVRWSTAQGLGYTGDPAKLFDPRVNIELGAKLLRQLWDRFKGGTTDIISAYNAGPRIASQRQPGQPYRNQAYVDKVLDFLSQYAIEPLALGRGLLLVALLVWYWKRRGNR